MALVFSYDDNLITDKDKVRYYLRDTVEGSGPLPEDINFTDNEILGAIALEGNWARAVAGGFEALASAWTTHPTFTADGYTMSMSHIQRGYERLAIQWRKKHGTAGNGNFFVQAQSVQPRRLDGHSEDDING